MELEPSEAGKPNGTRIRAGYDRWSAVYDTDRNPLTALEEPVMRESVGAVRGRDVLDLGCGTGRHTLWLAEAGARVMAGDFSSGMLGRARDKAVSRSLSVRFLAIDLGERLPLPAKVFDRVVSALVLEHLECPGHFFREVSRVLRGGGRAVVSTIHPAMFDRGSQARFTDPESGEVISPGSYAHGTEELLDAAEAAGLQRVAQSEHAPTALFAEAYPRAEKYIDYPMLLVLTFETSA